MYKSWWKKLDYTLIFLVLILIAYGFLMIYSANGRQAEAGGEVHRQLLYFAIGLVLMVIFASIDYSIFASFERYFYALNAIILILVIFIGNKALGAQRWISIGPFSFQPSEFAKIFVIISMAVWLSKDDALEFKKLSGLFAYMAFPMILILLQPDLGTSLVLIAILFAMLFVRGYNPFYILGFAAAGLAISPFILKEYQKSRLLIFLNPQSDPTGAGWNIIQSIVGIGSGGFWGKGLFSGTQTQLQFVPEHSTDFIFTVLGEELGFIGSAFIVILFFFLLWKMIGIAREAKDLTGSLIAVGITTMFFFHAFVNLGMTMGVMPVTGIPLPFISYGGSALIANMLSIGLLLNISLRRELFFKKETDSKPKKKLTTLNPQIIK